MSGKEIRGTCALCCAKIMIEDRKIAHYLTCKCPEQPIICPHCRHKRLKPKDTIRCHWCKETNPSLILSSHKRPNQANEITLLSRRWEFLRNIYPRIDLWVTTNFCSFTKFFHQQMYLSERMRRDSIEKLGAVSPRVLEKFRISFARLVICRFCQGIPTNRIFHELISHLRYLLFMAIKKDIRF